MQRPNKDMWFVRALRHACDLALEDGMIGNQVAHIEKIEVVDASAPITLRVTCVGDYSPLESTRVHENQSVMDVMDMIGRYLGDRAVRLSNLEELTRHDGNDS